jgi:ATP phosphoribosyltransferase regulatory subunit
MSAWVLPDHIADVLPSEARHIEEIRRDLLDMARCYGYELVMPPLLEHLESLLSGTGVALDLQTFKLVDQLSGRMMGLRADSTPQVARIDAHLLNRQGVARLCYCGPVLHTRPSGPQASREPLQFGAEIYGHAGLEADLEILTLALDALRQAKAGPLTVDLADARIVSALLAASGLPQAAQEQVHTALAGKDATELAAITNPASSAVGSNVPAACPADIAAAIQSLVGRYGSAGVLESALQQLPALPEIRQALGELQWPRTLPTLLTTCRSASIWPTCAATPITPACVFPFTHPRRTMRWPVVDAMTRWVRCLGASARPWASAWT